MRLVIRIGIALAFVAVVISAFSRAIYEILQKQNLESDSAKLGLKQKDTDLHPCLFVLELVIRIELMTSSLPMTCSTD